MISITHEPSRRMVRIDGRRIGLYRVTGNIRKSECLRRPVLAERWGWRRLVIAYRYLFHGQIPALT